MSDEIDYEKAFFQHIDQINALEFEIDRLVFQLNAWRELADLAVMAAANLSVRVGSVLIRARTVYGCKRAKSETKK